MKTPERKVDKSFSKHLTRLQPKQIIKIGQDLYEVAYVNESRANVVPLKKEAVTIVDPVTGKVTKFTRTARSLDISPNSEVEIVKRSPPPASSASASGKEQAGSGEDE